MPHNWASRATNLQLILREAWTCLHRHYGDDSEGRSCGLLVIPASSSQQPAHASHLCSEFFGEASNQPGDSAPYSPDLVPCDFWLFPTLKSPLKGKGFQTIDEIQENTTGQLLATRRTVWGPKVPTLKGTRCHCPVYNVSCIFNKCFYFSCCMTGYLLDRHYTYIYTYLYMYRYIHIHIRLFRFKQPNLNKNVSWKKLHISNCFSPSQYPHTFINFFCKISK